MGGASQTPQRDLGNAQGHHTPPPRDWGYLVESLLPVEVSSLGWGRWREAVRVTPTFLGFPP